MDLGMLATGVIIIALFVDWSSSVVGKAMGVGVSHVIRHVQTWVNDEHQSKPVGSESKQR